MELQICRVQARDMLEHLSTSPISNSSVDVVQGSRSVEVRAAGVSKGATINRILLEIFGRKTMCMPIDYVLCLGHFLGKDKDIYTFFDPELPPEATRGSRTKAADVAKYGSERKAAPKHDYGRSSGKSQGKTHLKERVTDKKSSGRSSSSSRRAASPESTSRHVINLEKDNYFSCAVGRTRTSARYLLGSSDMSSHFSKRWQQHPRQQRKRTRGY